MKGKRKDRLARRLADQLTQFYPEHRDEFLCPACLTVIDLRDRDNITDAHIIPEAAGGRIWTVLCSRCNSRFGTAQDKWMGEVLHLRSVEHPRLQPKTQAGHFEIDGLKVAGETSVSDKGVIHFTVWEDRISPATKMTLEKRFSGPAPHGPVKVTLPPPPVLNHTDVAIIGF